MLFPRKTWALRVTERMGLIGSSRETRLLVDLLIWSAKQEQQMLKTAGAPQFSKPESILMGAISMVNNHSAVSNVAKELGLDQLSALGLLTQMQAAGIDLIEQHDFTSLRQFAQRQNLK
jgi:DNA-binding MarR family transcriptional regulator